MPRSANAVVRASEVSGEGGTGLPNGRTRVILQSSRTPRATRWSCSIRAHSLGAGGHLNGAPHTAMTALPCEKPAIASRIRSAPANE